MRYDLIIVGAGGAGLVCAINAKEKGAKVLVLTKEYPTRSQTSMAQGGINAVINTEEDSIETHIEDTLKSAHGLADKDFVKILCQEAPKAVTWLDSIGVPFSRTDKNQIAQRKLGGAYSPRACYAQDYTGLKILHTLYDKCLSLDIEILNERYLLEILTDKDKDNNYFSCGVSVLNKRDSTTEVYESKSVVLATGGYSRIFNTHSTNSTNSTGDGIAIASIAGARLSDMEFIQFHPTALKKSAILISESARGAGGYLLNSKSQRFTNELAPRDEVARAIDDEMQKGEEIFLDIRHLGEKFINEELPQERKLSIIYENIDPVYDPIPIKPAAHYTMGGIEVDENTMTNIDGLFAVGECANHKVHGANRLGGNSLLELVVFGKLTAQKAYNYAQKIEKQTKIETRFNIGQYFKNSKNKINFYDKQKIIGDIFYKNVAIKRDEKNLHIALDEVLKIKNELHLMGIEDKSKIYNTNLIEFLEFKNMLELCEKVIYSALKRKESRGAHFRTDAPKEKDEYNKHSVIDKNNRISYED